MRCFLMCVLIVLSANTSFADDYVAVMSGPWKAPTTWKKGLTQPVYPLPAAGSNKCFMPYPGNPVPMPSPGAEDNAYIGSSFYPYVGSPPLFGAGSVSVYLSQNQWITDLYLGYGMGAVGKLDMNGHTLIASQMFIGQNGGTGTLLNRGPLSIDDLEVNGNFNLLPQDSVLNFSIANGKSNIDNGFVLGLKLDHATAVWNNTISILEMDNGSTAKTSAMGNVGGVCEILSGSKLTLGVDMSPYWLGVANGWAVNDSGTLDMANHNVEPYEFDFGLMGKATLLNQGTLNCMNLAVGHANKLTLGPGNNVVMSTVLQKGAALTVTGSAIQTCVFDMPLDGGVDLQDGGTKLILNYTGGTSPAAAVLAAIKKDDPFFRHLPGGTIFSSNALLNGYSLGWLDDNNSVTVMTTLFGDANLDGKVDAADLTIAENNYGKSGVWATGDFNYDGVVDSADIALVTAHMGQSLPSYSGPGSSVPEPGAFILLGIGLLILALKKAKSLLFVFVLMMATTAFATDYGAVQNGNWNSSSTWTTPSVPTASDDVYIGSNYPVGSAGTATVAMTQNQSAGNVYLGYGTGSSGILNMGGHTLIAYQGVFGQGGSFALSNRGPISVTELSANGNLDLNVQDWVYDFSLSNGTSNIHISSLHDLSLDNATANWSGSSLPYLELNNNSIATGNANYMVKIFSGSKLTANANVTIQCWLQLGAGVDDGNPSYSTLDLAGHSLGVRDFYYGLGNGKATILNQGRLSFESVFMGGSTLNLYQGDLVTRCIQIQNAGTLTVAGTASQMVLNTTEGLNMLDQGTKVIFNYDGGSSPASTIHSILSQSYNGAVPFDRANGAKIYSSTAAVLNQGLGWIDNGSNVTIMHTLYGDATVDGVVNYNDISLVAAHYGGTGTWGTGDFNYDGKVDFTDLNALVGNYTGVYNIPVEADKLDVQGINLLASHGFALAFPEPGTFVLLAIGLTCLIIWAWNKKGLKWKT